MDETKTSTQYRLCIDFTSAQGFTLHAARDVDTFAEAERIAEEGRSRDEADGGKTSYRLCVWDNYADRSTLRQAINL